jgi:integrase
MESLQKDLELQFKSSKAAHEALVILGKFVAFANKLGKGSIPQPRISHLVVKPPNPFRDGVAHNLLCVRTWLDLERKWIKECAVAPPVELVVLSAILHGGVLHTTSVVDLTRALLTTSMRSFGCIGERIYVDLALGWTSEPETEDRRWYPDNQTASLIRRPEEYARSQDWLPFDSHTSDQILRLLFRNLRQRMRSDHVQKELRPSSLKQLVDIVAAAARTEVPAVLIEYAARRIVAHSLKFDTLQRLYGVDVGVPTTANSCVLKDDLSTSAEGLPPVDESSTDMEPDWITRLRAAFRAKDTQALQINLRALISSFPTPSCPGHRITDFALYLLTERHRDFRRFVSHKPLSIKTVEAYTLTVARRFGRILGEQDPVALTPENIETLYTKVIENVVEGENPQQLRRTVTNALREFSKFIVGKLGANEIDDRSILGACRGLLPVDAKIITPEQYSEARRILRNELHRKYDRNILQAAEVMLILGFRCGTRRMEAYGLELSDLTDRYSPLLLIRPTDARQLKTDNAKRQLPLWSLMADADELGENELEVLYSWKRARIEDGCLKMCPHLFSVPELNDAREIVLTPLPIQKLIAALHDALRQATGDPTLHYHHLRHSFATWTFLRLMLSDLPTIPDLFPHRAETKAWLQKAKAFRAHLYGTTHPTRKHAMAVASLLGHSGPTVSLEHYVHCMDMLLPLFLAQSRLLQLCPAQVALASGLPRGTVNEWKQRFGADSIPALIFKRRFPERVIVSDAGSSAEALSYVADSIPQRWVSNTWDLLYQSGTTSEPVHDLADRLGFDFDVAQAILARARTIQQIKEPRGKQINRHRMESVVINRLTPDEKTDIACPWLPKSEKDKKVIDALESILGRLALEQSATTKAVFGYYINNLWLTRNMLPFRDPDMPDDAVRYLAFLHDLEIPVMKTRFGFFDHHERSTSRSKWKRAFKLTWRHRDRIETCEPPYGANCSSDRWCGLEPDFRSSSSEESSNGSNGFRFLMVVAAIRFGYADESR